MEIEDIRDTIKEIKNQIFDLYRDVDDLLDKMNIEDESEEDSDALCARARLNNRKAALESQKIKCDLICDELYNIYCNNDLGLESQVCIKGSMEECKILSSELHQEIDAVCDYLTDSDEELTENIECLIDEINKVLSSCLLRLSVVEYFYRSLL